MTIVSCSDAGSELDRTIFIPDAENSSLPAYSEWGYNSFGAVYNQRSTFVVNNSIAPFNIIYHDDSLLLSLSGVVSTPFLQDRLMELYITFPCEPMDDFTDLLLLHKRVVDLKESKVLLSIGNETPQVLNVLGGDFTFKRAQLLSVDDKLNRIILSGTFDLRYLAANGLPDSFQNGRFDFGVDQLDSY
jgi:hypothetical protein